MKKTSKRITALLLAVMMVLGMMNLSVFADSQSQTAANPDNGLSSITANTTIAADGSITIKGTANLHGWIDKIAVFKGNQMANPANTYLNGELVGKAIPSSTTMKSDYEVRLVGSKVTTAGYTVIVATADAATWAACYVASPAGTQEGVGGNPDEEIDDSNIIGNGTVKVTAKKNADGSVTFSGTVSVPASLQYVVYKIGNHMESPENCYASGIKLASYATNDTLNGTTDLINGASYTFNKTFTGRNVSEVGYTICFQDQWKTNFTAAFIPTQGGTGYDPYQYFGKGVDDATLKEWATIHINNKWNQTFAVNEVKSMLNMLGEPARTKNADRAELEAWYTEVKPVQEYQWDELFLNDYYVQGVWDTMPANYGWMQDQYTTPGKWVAEHFNLGQLGYGIALGGNNPWVLLDYIERNIGVPGANTDGWSYGYDEIAEAPYLWHAPTGMMLTYENYRSMDAKIEYLNDPDVGVGGTIIWEMSGDNTDIYPMTKRLYEGAPNKRVVGYFVNWAVYNDFHQKQSPLDLPYPYMTHINYSFMQIENNQLQTMDAWADTTGELDYGAPAMFAKVKMMKEQYPHIKVLFSVGGWTRGDTFNEMVSNPANRKTFCNSVVKWLKDYPQFDGIDLDWEYPGTSARAADHDDPNDRGCPTGKEADYENYAAIVKELRAALDADPELVERGSNLLTACLPSAPQKQDVQDCVSIANACDFVNIMTYDYHGAFDPVGPKYNPDGTETGEYWPLGYNISLYPHPETPDEWCTANSVKNLVAKGIPAEKLNIGTAYYSRGWAGIPVDENGIPRGIIDPTPLDPNDVNVDDTTLSVDKKEITVEVGKSETVTATSNKAVTWTSADTSVATVSNGKITGVKAGTTTVTAKAGSKQVSVKVTVKDAEIVVPEMTVTLTADKSSVTSGSVIRLTTTVKNGTGPYTYRYLVEDTSGKQFVLRDNAGAKYIINPASAKNTKFLVIVTDSKGKQATGICTVTVR